MKDRLPKTIGTGEPHFNASRANNKIFRGCLGRSASGQEKRLGGLWGFLHHTHRRVFAPNRRWKL